MKNNILIKTLCLIFSLSMLMASFVGCNGTKQSAESSSSKPQKTETGEPEDNSANPTESLPEDTDPTESEEDFDDILGGDDDYLDFDDDYGDEEESLGELYDLDATVYNGKALSTRYTGPGMGVHSGFTYMKDSYGRVTTDKMAKHEMDRLKNMGIHTVRSMFKFLWARKSGDSEWDWETDDMKAFYRFLGEMKDRDINVMINPWAFGWLSRGDSSIPDSKYFLEDDYNLASDKWCDMVVELFKQLKARGYTNAKYLVLFTEPISPDDYEKYGDDEFDRYILNAKNLNKKLTDAKLRDSITIIGPNRTSFDLTLLKKIIKECPEAFDIYSGHNYLRADTIVSDVYMESAHDRWGHYVDLVKTDKSKPFWIDEWNIQDESLTEKGYSNVGFDEPWRGVQQAVGVISGMNMGIDGMSLWGLSDQQWPNQINTSTTSGFYDGVNFHGLFYNIQEKITPKAQYYAYSLLTKYGGEHNGTTYYASTDMESMGVHMSALKTEAGDLTVIVANTNIEDAKLDIKFQQALKGVKLYKHMYVASKVKPNSNSQIIPASRVIKNVTTDFTDYVAGGSVTVYTTIKD